VLDKLEEVLHKAEMLELDLEEDMNQLNNKYL